MPTTSSRSMPSTTRSAQFAAVPHRLRPGQMPPAPKHSSTSPRRESVRIGRLGHRYFRQALNAAMVLVLLIGIFAPASSYQVGATPTTSGGSNAGTALSASKWHQDSNLAQPVQAAQPIATNDGLPAKHSLQFEANLGQADKAVRFLARIPGGTLSFRAGEVSFDLYGITPDANDSKPGQEYPKIEQPSKGKGQPTAQPQTRTDGSLAMRFIEASPSQQLASGQSLPGIVSYFTGGSSAKWHTNIPTYSSVVYKGLYPNINLRYDGYLGQLKGTYYVSAGGDPTKIRWRYDSAKAVSIDKDGNLRVQATYTETTRGVDGKIIASQTQELTMVEHRPIAWQEIGGKRVPVSVRYKVGGDSSIGFDLGTYDRSLPLTIDPTLTYSTYYGGLGGTDQINAVARDGAGNIYIAGNNSRSEAFVVKLDPSGTTVLYSAFFNGTCDDYCPYSYGNGLFVDSSGYAYLVGATNASNFPTQNPFQSHLNGQLNTYDAFVTKLGLSGSTLEYSTYLGGGTTSPYYDDRATGVAVDATGSAYVVGSTYASNFPTHNPLQANSGGGLDAFITKFNPSGSTLAFSTYLGGVGDDVANGIALDGAGTGNAFIVGMTASANFPTSAAYQTLKAGAQDAFLTSINAAGSTFVFSTYFGGTGLDIGYGVAVNSSGNPYIVGATSSADFPTLNALQPGLAGGRDAFVTEFNTGGQALLYSTYLGGSDYDDGYAIAVNSAGNAYVTGQSQSGDFPVTNAIQWSNAGSQDAFIAKLNSSGSSLIYSTYLGGSVASPFDGEDQAFTIAVDNAGHAYVGGSTKSADFPTTPDALQPNHSGPQGGYVYPDAFLSVIDDLPVTMPTPTRRPTNTPSNTPTITPTYTPTATPTNTATPTITNTPLPGNCLSFEWVDLVNVAANGNSIIKTSADHDWDAGALSSQAFQSGGGGNGGDGYVQVTAASIRYDVLFGLSTGNPDPGYANIDFGIHLGGNDSNPGAVEILEGGSGRPEGWLVPYSVGDVFRVAREGNVVRYYQNGTLFYTSTVTPPAGPLYLDTSIFTPGGQVQDALICNGVPPTPASTSTPTPTPTQVAPNVPELNELRCGGSPSQRSTTSLVGYGVNAATGSFCYGDADFSIPGRGAPLEFARTYNSDMAAISSTLGYGWTHNYNMYIDRDAANNYLVHEENGSVSTFGPDFTRPLRVMATLSQANTNGDLVFTRIHGQVSYYFRNLGGSGIYRLISIVDRNNHPVTLSYVGGQLRTVTDPGGRHLNFDYYTLPPFTGLLRRVTDDTGRRVAFTYYPNGDLNTATDVGNTIRLFTYDLSHHLQVMTEPRNLVQTAVFNNTYDSGGGAGANVRVTHQTYPMSRSTDFGYTGDVAAATTRITNTLGIVTVRNYSQYMLMSLVDNATSEQPGLWSYTYKPGTTWLWSVEDPLHHIWRSDWDNNGNLASTTDPLNNYTQYTYYLPENDLHQVFDPGLVATTYEYDANGNVTSVSRPWIEGGGGQTMRTGYSYDQSPSRLGDLLTVTDARNHDWHRTYDQYGYPDTVSDPLNNTTNYDYDSVGRLLRVEDPNHNPTTYVPNSYGDTKSVTNALGYTTVYTYDQVRLLQSVRDAKGNVTRYDYNINNELRLVSQPEGVQTGYSYDGVGRVISRTNDLGQTTNYTFDDLNDRWHSTDPLGRTFRTEYDKAGNVSGTLDAAGMHTTYIYYPDNRLQTVDYADPNTHDVSYTYNSRGLRDSMSDGLGTVSYVYDSLYRLTSTSRDFGGGNIGGQVDYGYDLANNLVSILYPTNRDGIRRFATYTFNEANRMDTISGSDDNNQSRSLSGFGYDNNGNLISINTPSDVGLTRGFGYDKANQVLTSTSALQGGTSDYTQVLTYTRDPVGLVQSSGEVRDHPQLVARHIYSYDKINRLTGDDYQNVDPSQNISSTWRMDGGSQVKRSTTLSASGPPVVVGYAYDDANQLTVMTTTTGITPLITNRGSMPTANPSIMDALDPDANLAPNSTRQLTSFRYNPTGNRTSQTQQTLGGQTYTTTYGPDQADRLTHFASTSTDFGTGDYSFGGDGLRIRRQVTFGDTYATTSTWDVVQGLPLLLQDLGVCNGLCNPRNGGDSNYLYGPGDILLGQLSDSSFPGPGRPDGSGASSNKSGKDAGGNTAGPSSTSYRYIYFTTDQAGSIRNLVSHNELLTSYIYDSYGKRTCDPNYCIYHTPFGFTGQYTDRESDLLYMRARHYDPATQQFISRDPAEAATGQPYVYANRNPVNYVDPGGAFSLPTSMLWQTRGEGEGITEGPDGGAKLVSPGGEPVEGGAGGAGAAQAAEAAQPAIKGRGDLAWESANYGEDAYAKANPTFIKRIFRTDQGNRRVDFYDPVERVIHEVKTGYQGLRTKISRQIAKDVELLYGDEVQGVVWHFYKSPINGRIGPTEPLKEMLVQNLIRVELQP